MGLFERWLQQPGIQAEYTKAIFEQIKVNEPYYMNTSTYEILSRTNEDMKPLGLKEALDYSLNQFGLYGKKKLSDELMLQDNLADLAVNAYELSCSN